MAHCIRAADWKTTPGLLTSAPTEKHVRGDKKTYVDRQQAGIEGAVCWLPSTGICNNTTVSVYLDEVLAPAPQSCSMS